MSADQSPVAERVDAAMLGMAYGRLHVSVGLTIVIALTFVGLVARHLPLQDCLAWLAVLMLVSLARLALWFGHRRRAAARSDAFWRRCFMLGALCAGLAWSVGPVRMLADGGLVGALLLGLTVLSVSAVAVASMATQATALRLFLLGALGPTCAALWATGGSAQAMAALILLAAGALLSVVGHMTGRATRALLDAELRLAQAVEANRVERERAEAASQAKTRFLATMSHELRTPLNAVIGAAQLLRLQTNDAAGRESLTVTIERSGQNLLGLIDNVLDLAQIETGQLRPQPAAFDLPACIEAATDGARMLATAKALRLDVRIDPALSSRRLGDEARVRQVLLNLLGNAVKFTASGQVVLAVAPDTADDFVRFTVTDTGIGIPANALPHIFDAFRQADEGTRRRFGGSGLGLSIVAQIVRALGGTIEVRSDAGQGSCFTLWLPLPVVAAAEAPAVVAAGRRHAPAGRQVLVVEDDPLNQAVVCALLRHAGYRVSVAGDGHSAIERVRGGGIDAVLMDWMMPDMDGIEVTRRLRAGEAGVAGGSVPVIALTANAFDEDRAACLAAGMDDFLTKPVLADDLVAALERVLPAMEAGA